MEFDQLKLVGGLSAFFLLFGVGCWLLLQTATMGDNPADQDFFGEVCTIIDNSRSSTSPCAACVALSHQLISQASLIGPLVYGLPGINTNFESTMTGAQ